ncbi:thioesterase family protein [Aldersonia sp. NBC_00410]|uniref:thioesterase family protein n=1 Tax=Aldersonia sp. NBC_00410 TaxID=2975954 RepID=UPI0022517928|nr:acyl-CoA thioesterase domain-containing protein [Aldersonia sp. NBC_00410]MCX5045191.1 thioesterase family protein [Aldersonia sp. NBC_00410]
MSTSLAYFEQGGADLVPTKYAVSSWAPDMLSGPVVCGVLARAIENAYGAHDFQPSRLTVDMFRPARTKRFDVATTLVRDGNRIRVADAEIVQDGEPVARASVVFLRRSSPPPGEFWSRAERPQVPPASLTDPTDRPHHAVWGSDAGGWTRHRGDHQGVSRKRIWLRQLDLVAGETPSPFITAVTVGELTSMVNNWGSEGVGYINADLTVALTRLPVGREIGVEADNHLATDGISVGTSTLFDTDGAFGTGVVTALSNAKRMVDYSGTRPRQFE